MTLRARLLHSSDTLTMAKALSDLLAEDTRLKSLSSATGSSSHSVLAAPLLCFKVAILMLKKMNVSTILIWNVRGQRIVDLALILDEIIPHKKIKKRTVIDALTNQS
jgi:hypothetical protein